METKNSSRYHENPYPNYVKGETSNLFCIKDNDVIALNETLDKKIRQTVARLVNDIDKEYESSDKFHDLDHSVYVGTSGQAMFYFFYYLNTRNSKYLDKAQRLIERALRRRRKRRFSFLNGDAGPLAISALIYEALNKEEQAKNSITELKALAHHVIDLNSDTVDEILYGRAGYLYSLLFVNKNVKCTHVDGALIRQVVESILKSGQALSAKKQSSIPLEYEWHEKNYYGAAHGVAGILFTLLKANAHLTDRERDTLVKPTLDALLKESLPSGNLKSSQGSSADRLVQWCHGCPGFVSLLEVAYEIYKDQSYLDSLLQSSDHVWEAGLLRKGYSLCHGVAGNAYSFLTVYHATHNEEQLYRALCFADWCTQYNQHEEMVPDRPCSMYEGKAGLAFFLLDILKPTNAKFPGYEDI
uniref:LanC-like protein 2 n=2 Tax=Cacopsylla melanoneura TaxID=428564 RepID=A0A8D9FCI1_9HEMI